MDEDLPPWNKHGSHNISVPYNTGGDCQKVGYSNYISASYDKVVTEVNYGEKAEEFSHSTWIQTQPKSHDFIGHSSEEDMPSLSSCMSGAFQALLPDYHGTSSTMTTNTVKYSSSSDDHRLFAPATIMDDNKAVDGSIFLKDTLDETSASVTHMLPLRCAQYVHQEKNRELDKGNCNWTSVIKDALEMSNGMAMEQTISMDACGPLLDFNPLQKGHETEETIIDHCQIPEVQLNEKYEQRVKGEPNSYISVLSDGISTRKDVFEMGESEPPSILDVGSSVEEFGKTGIREHEPGYLQGLNRSSCTPLYSSFSLVKQSFEGNTQGHELSCNDVSPRKTASNMTCIKHVEVNMETVSESSTAHGLHHLDPQKGCHQAEFTEGKTCSSHYNVQDNAELILNVETKPAPEIQDSSTGSENVPDEDKMKTIHTDFKCMDSQVEPDETGKLNQLCILESSSKHVTLLLTSAPERATNECDIYVQEKQSPGRTDCSPQPIQQKVRKNHRKGRKKKKSKPGELCGSIHKSILKDDCPVYGSDKADTTECEEVNQNISLTDRDSLALKEEDFPTNGDGNLTPPKGNAPCQVSKLELVADTAETSPKKEYGCSETCQEEVQSSARINKAVSKRKSKKRSKSHLKAKTRNRNQQLSPSMFLSIEEDCMVSETALVKEANDPTVVQQPISSLESSVAEKKKKMPQTKKRISQKLQSKDDPLENVPTTLSEDVIKSPKGKKVNNSHSLLNLQSSDSVSTLVTEPSNIISLQKSPKASKKRKIADIDKSTITPDVCPHEDVPLPLSQSKENMANSSRKTVKGKRPVQKTIIKDANESTLLDIQPSLKQKDSVSTAGTEVESPLVLSSPIKSVKKKQSNNKQKAVNITTVDQTAQQSVLNLLSESDTSTAQPTIRSFRTRKTLDKKVENYEPDHSNEANSSADSMLATETEFSGVRQKNMKKKSSTRRKSNTECMEGTSITRQQEDITVLPSEESVVVFNPAETVKVKRLCRKKTIDNHANGNMVREAETQDNNITPLKKISGVKSKAVHTPISDQTLQPKIHPSDSLSATEMDNSDVLHQKKTKIQSKKTTKRRTRRAGCNIIKRSFPAPLQQENSTLTTNPCIITETETACLKKQVSTTTEESPQRLQKKAKKMRGKQLLEQKEEYEQSVLEPAHREDKMSDVPSVIRDAVSENFEMLETDRKDFIKEEMTIEPIKIPKKRGRKPGRKKMKRAGLLTKTIKEEENNKVQTSDTSQKTAIIPEEPVTKSTQMQKINSGPSIENLSIENKSTVFLDMTDCHTELEETLSSSIQSIDCEDKRTVKQKPRKRGRPLKKRKLPTAHLKDNTSPPAKMSKNDSCQEGIENTVKASASPVKQELVQPLKESVKVDQNVMVTVTDPSESPLSADDPLSQSIPARKGKKGTNFTKEIRNLRLSSLRASSRTSETSAKDSEKADIPSLSQNTTQVFSEDGKLPLLMPVETVKEEKTAIQDVGVLKNENGAPIKVVKRKKHGRKRRKIKKPSHDLISKINIDDIVVSSNVVESSESELVLLDEKSNPPKIKPNNKLKHIQEIDGQSVEMSDKKQLDSSPKTENAFRLSMEHKVDGFTQNGEDCVVMPNKLINKRKSFKPKEKGNKPLTCKYCGISFRHITAYAIHQRIHTGDKPYKCKICGKTFAQLSKLKSHHNVHKQDASFPCPCCSRNFLQKDDLLCHFKVHLQESKPNSEQQNGIKRKRSFLPNVSSKTPNKYRCLICKLNFVNHVKLQNHMQSHEIKEPLSCKDCGKNFWKLSSLAAHEKTHWPVKPYACSICGRGFNQLKALKRHSQDHAGETPFSCFHCGHAFSAFSALRMHQASKTCIARKKDEANDNVEGFIVSQGVDGQVNTPVFFKCQLCKQLFRKWCQYTLHLQTHTSSPPYICFSCGQCYEKDSDMNVHCEVCCQSSGEEKICVASLSEILTKTYPLKRTSSQSLPSTGIQQNSQIPTSSEQLPKPPQTKDLSKHPKSVSSRSPNKLPIAQSPARSDISRKSTVSSVECTEITPSLWKFKCSHCGQRFKQYRTLSAHLQTHGHGFRYTCAHCGQFFERWSKLWLHRRCHLLKSRSYHCNQCSLQFRFFSSFKEHMIGHVRQTTDDHPPSPKTFIQEASLHAHESESHNLQKSLKCDVCSKTFSNLRNLVKHSLLHNGSTSHVCLICNLSFTNARVLKEHLKMHNTNHGPALPDIPSKPLDFSHKCKRCKASFSSGDLLYAHQICHSRDAKTSNSTYCTAEVPTSKVSASCSETPSTQPSTQRNNLSDLKLDSIPNDVNLYVYSHPDKLYVPPSHREQLPLINLDPDEREVISQNTDPEPEIASQSDGAELPQATSGQETTSPNIIESIKEMEDGKHDSSPKNLRRSTFVETSVDMEVETPPQQEESECFECADCTEKLTSVLSLYEHYILHAMGDTYLQVH